MFVGTPLMSLYYRAMGARIGRDVTLCTSLCSAFDLVSIGDRTSIGVETHVLGYHVENGTLIIGGIDIGRDCFIGMHCNVGLDTRIGDWARLDDMSLAGRRRHAWPFGESRRGSPAAPVEVGVPVLDKPDRKRRRPFLYGAIHFGLIYAMGYFLILSAAPAVALVVFALMSGGPLWGIAAAFAAVPISVLWYALLLVAVKRLCIGRIEAGVYPLESSQYLRYWFLSYLLGNTRTLLMPVYATVYFPTLLRLLGAKIGPGTEISTVMHVTPDLLTVGAGSFLADACLVGGNRVHHGHIDLGGNRIGEKTFVGNSAVLPSGSNIGDNALLGVLSAPASGQHLPDNERWLGAPAFALPQTQKDLNFSDAQTYQPSRAAFRNRAISDAVRILLPGLIATGSLVAFIMLLVLAYRSLPLWQVVAGVPLLAAAPGDGIDDGRRRRQAAADGHLRPDRAAAVVPLRLEQRDRQRHLRVVRRDGHDPAAGHAVRLDVHALDGLQDRQVGVPRDHLFLGIRPGRDRRPRRAQPRRHHPDAPVRGPRHEGRLPAHRHRLHRRQSRRRAVRHAHAARLDAWTAVAADEGRNAAGRQQLDRHPVRAQGSACHEP